MQSVDPQISQLIESGDSIPVDMAKNFIVNASRTRSAIFKNDDGFRRSQDFLALLSNPQDAVPTIHIAGTSGKGSVSAILDRLLLAHGKSTGRYNSPHVYDLLERWQSNSKTIDEQVFSEIVSDLFPHFLEFQKTVWKNPTYYELATAVAFLLFRKLRPDYAIVETGLGGLYDTTNTISRSDKLAVITQLGLDHTDILGNTLDKIAFQKAGILPTDGQAIVLEPDSLDAKRAINQVARDKINEVNYLSPLVAKDIRVSQELTTFNYHTNGLRLDDLQISLIGEHQAVNTSLALSALEFLAKRDNFVLDDIKIRQALKGVSLPGRFERRKIYDHPVILDGAHNPQKLSALVGVLKQIYPNRKFTCLIAFGKTKDADNSLKIIAPLVDSLIVTTFFADQDMKLSQKAGDPQMIAKFAKNAGIKNITIEPNNCHALEIACQKDDDLPAIITGSFFLIGEMPN